MATFNTKLKPFEVPTHVTLDLPQPKHGEYVSATLPLEALDEDTLNAMIEEFALAVMTAAGKA